MNAQVYARTFFHNNRDGRAASDTYFPDVFLRAFGNLSYLSCTGKFGRLLWKRIWNYSWYVLEICDVIFFSIFVSQISLTLSLDRVLLGHVIDSVLNIDEFECRLRCIGEKGCKSINIRRNGNKKNFCELNSQNRQTMPQDFRVENSSTYHGFVQVSYLKRW